MINGVRFREGVPYLHGMRMRYAYAKTSDGKESCWGFDPDITSDDEAATRLMEECKKLGITILHEAYFIPGNSHRGMYCPKCRLKLDMSMCGYDSYGYLCHAGCL